MIWPCRILKTQYMGEVLRTISSSIIGQLLLLTTVTISGVLLASGIGMPIPLLTGPAIVATIASVAGVNFKFPLQLRNAVFLLAGITIGATVSPESVEALTRWPLAFALLIFAVLMMVMIGLWILPRLMQTDTRSALLAAAPGHLSFVIALGESLNLETSKVAVVQSIRLLSLTLIVPFSFQIAGIEADIGLSPAQGAAMDLSQTALCLICAIAFVPIVKLTKIPAPVLMAGMVVGAVARLSGFSSGGLSHWIAFPALAAIGTLIGTRFAGIGMAQLRESALAGLASTALAAALTLLAAWIAKDIVQMPLSHVFVAFAPGGLETMAIMGAAIGANPGFVAAAHVARLLFLSLLIPILMTRTPKEHSTPNP